MRHTCLASSILVVTALSVGAQNIITSVAGNPYIACGAIGDGGPATSATLCNPQSPAFDGSGNIYFYDYGNYRIRKIDRNGIITTIAGNGTRGTSGDGGQAVSASLGSINQLAVDPSSQQLCFGDNDARKIRCVSLNTGIIQGYGTGVAGYGGDGGPVANATFYQIMGAAFDNNANLYVSDFQENRVRRVDAVTGIVTTFAGPGPGYCCAPVGDGGKASAANIYEPWGLAYQNGAIYIADQGNARIRKVDLASNIITTVVGNGTSGFSGDGGSALSATVVPRWVTVDNSGNIFLDSSNVVRMVDATSGIINTIAGTPGTSGFGYDDIPATQTVFSGINGVAWDPVAVRVLIPEYETRIRQIFFTPPTSTTLTSSENPALPNDSVTFTASVTPTDATGSLRFYNGNQLLGSALLTNAVATFSWTAPAQTGTYNVRAVYGGDPTHNLSQSATLTENVQVPTTTTSVSSSLNPSVQGQSVTFTASVTPGAATGSVAFRSNGVTLGTSTLSNGSATFTSSTLPPGSNSITASYNGSSSFTGSTSPALVQTVKTGTTTTLTGNPNPSTAGTAVTLTATVSPGAATGTVQFFNSGTLLGTVNLTSPQAQLVVSTLPAGTDSLTAVYSGDANYGGSTGTLSQVVKTGTTTTLTSSPNPSTFAGAVTLTASVTPVSATGQVQFFNSGAPLGSASLANGRASLSVSTMPAGSDSLTASYLGDAANAPSTSASVAQTVNKASSTTKLTASPASQASSGQTVTFTATVTPGAATGMVQFLDGSLLIGSGTLNNGTAVLSISTLAMGNHSIKASYGGDGNVNGSQSAALTYKISKH